MDPLTGRLAGIVCTYCSDVRSFLRRGKLAFAYVCVLSLAFLAGRALLPLLCLRLLGCETAPAAHVVEVQIALIFLVFFAPTPGAAGLAEGASISLMSGIVPGGVAPWYNLLWRFTTLYLAAIAGFICLWHSLRDDARQLACRRAR